MAAFLPAWMITRKNEGGYCNTPGDLGGKTYRGISYNNFPNWAGWPVIDAAHLQRGEICLNAEPLVVAFYTQNFWNPIMGDEIINQDTANELFDSAVNMGLHEAIVLTQRTLNIPETGHMDSSTLNVLNQNNPYA